MNSATNQRWTGKSIASSVAIRINNFEIYDMATNIPSPVKKFKLATEFVARPEKYDKI